MKKFFKGYCLEIEKVKNKKGDNTFLYKRGGIYGKNLTEIKFLIWPPQKTSKIFF